MVVLKKRIKVFVYCLIILIPLIDIIVNISTKKIKIFPLEKLEFDIYNEEETDTAKSFVDAYSNDSIFTFEYRLKEKETPIYTGAMFYQSIPEGIELMDLNGINKIFISVHAEFGKRIPVFLICYYKLNKNGKDTTMYRPFEAFINYSMNKKGYIIDFDEFKTPNWWFTENGLNESEIEGIQLDRISSVNIENCKVIDYGVHDTISINEFYLYSDNTSLFLRAMIYTILNFFIALFIFSLLKKKRIHVWYKPTTIKIDDKSKDKPDVLNYITANYMNPELSLNSVSSELKISTLEISKIIKEKYQLSFKKYLNNLRITEVKRLLSESELSISEIAYQAGYNNISHFNRIFKSETNITPKEYRNNLLKS